MVPTTRYRRRRRVCDRDEQQNRHARPAHTHGIIRSAVRQDARVEVLLRLYQQVPGAPSAPVLRDGNGFRQFRLGRRVRRCPRDPVTTIALLLAPLRKAPVRMLHRSPDRVRALSTRRLPLDRRRAVLKCAELCFKICKPYDKRTTGLFKLEWSGDGFVGLRSKKYYCSKN